MMETMKRWIGILAVGGALAAGGASAGDGFALRLWRAAAGEEGNVVMSPFSVAEAMGMVLAGAEGDTAEEIAKAVLPDGVADVPGYFSRVNGDLGEAAGAGRLQIANALWTREGLELEKKYVRVVEEAFGGVAEASPWGGEGAARANQWAAEATGGRIRDLFGTEMFGEGTELVLANAVCFQGRWESAFDPGATADGAFRLRDGRGGRTPMMHRKGRVAFSEWEDGAMVRLPYEGGDLEMRVAVPKNGTPLAALEARLEEEWDEWAEDAVPREVKVWLPRFRIRWGAESLKGALERLGVGKAFGAEADFGGMGLEGGHLGDVVHAAEIEVDEEGTVAVAAAAAAMAKSMRREPPEFRADRPFLFAIVENVSGTVLFFGRVERPDGWVADEAEAGEESAGKDERGADDDVEEQAAAREESGGAADEEESEERR